MTLLPRRAAVLVFVAFAGAYFLSALIRAITATLSPVLTLQGAVAHCDMPPSSTVITNTSSA